jgi:hypothetical protein
MFGNFSLQDKKIITSKSNYRNLPEIQATTGDNPMDN